MRVNSRHELNLSHSNVLIASKPSFSGQHILQIQAPLFDRIDRSPVSTQAAGRYLELPSAQVIEGIVARARQTHPEYRVYQTEIINTGGSNTPPVCLRVITTLLEGSIRGLNPQSPADNNLSDTPVPLLTPPDGMIQHYLQSLGLGYRPHPKKPSDPNEANNTLFHLPPKGIVYFRPLAE
ncbi:MAG: hypothetical protein VKK59_00825 [Vampirovibrionales bacterium]|nr:hypothetical protein [Vampirovibrionales bacterium]